MAEIGGKKNADVSLPLFRHMILNTIRSYNMKFRSKFGQMVIACDGRKYWRKDEFEFYKAGRKKAREDSHLPWEQIFEALNQVKSDLDLFFPYPVIEIPRAEADDVIATLAEWTSTNELTDSGMFDDLEPQPFLIISGDHDFGQLQKFSHVSQYAPVQKKMIKIDMPPTEFLQEHIITGDKGDGVPNIKSPDNTFVDELRQKPIRKDDLARWRKMIPEDFCTEEMLRNYHRNARLIDFTYIPSDIKQEIIDCYLKQRGTRSKAKLLNFFMKNRMKNLIECVQDF